MPLTLVEDGKTGTLARTRINAGLTLLNDQMTAVEVTASRSLAVSDAHKWLWLGTAATGVNLVIPANATAAIPIGAKVYVSAHTAATNNRITFADGVTLNGIPASGAAEDFIIFSEGSVAGPGRLVLLQKIATDTWLGAYMDNSAASGLTTLSLLAGETIFAGQVGYVKSDGKIWLANASAEATSGPVLVGIIMDEADAEGGSRLQLSGDFTVTGPLTVGAPYFTSTTAGAYTATAPTADNTVRRIVAYATTTTNLRIVVSPEWIVNGGDPKEVWIIALGSSTGDAEVAAGVEAFRMPFAATLDNLRMSLDTAATGQAFIVDVKCNGASVFTTNLLSIDAGEKTSTTALVPANITTTSLPDDSEITFDITQIGSIAAGAGPKVTMYVREV